MPCKSSFSPGTCDFYALLPSHREESLLHDGPSVCPHVSAQISWERFRYNCWLETCIKVFEVKGTLGEVGQVYGALKKKT
jgi:hypothetical protein